MNERTLLNNAMHVKYYNKCVQEEKVYFVAFVVRLGVMYIWKMQPTIIVLYLLNNGSYLAANHLWQSCKLKVKTLGVIIRSS